jgi:hypothetical protein
MSALRNAGATPLNGLSQSFSSAAFRPTHRASITSPPHTTRTAGVCANANPESSVLRLITWVKIQV